MSCWFKPKVSSCAHLENFRMNRSLLDKKPLRGSSEQMAVWCSSSFPCTWDQDFEDETHSHGPKPCCPVPIKSESFPGTEPGQAAAAGQQKWKRSQTPAMGLCCRHTGFRRISVKLVISILPQWPHSSAWSSPSTPELQQDSPRTKISLQICLWSPDVPETPPEWLHKFQGLNGVTLGAKTHSWDMGESASFLCRA